MTLPSQLRVAVVSRIFAPEPSAATFRLSALARALHDDGATVRVVTTTPPPGLTLDDEGIDVRRAPVLRDRDGYVRGYLNYLSFDVPAFFRTVFARRSDAVIVEPPPTTGVVMRISCAIRRTPYIYYAADIWSEAAAVAGAPRLVVNVVRRFERFAMSGAAAVAAVSEDVAERVRAIAPRADVSVVGNGFDETRFSVDGPAASSERPYLLYAGTASEVHGAGIFIDAMPIVREAVPHARVVFVGQGADRDAMAARAEEIAPGAVEFLPRLSASETATWTRGARATLASVLPDAYVAFPTKMLASVACGTPVVYAGDEPGRSFALTPGVGSAVRYDVHDVAAAMIAALRTEPTQTARHELAAWALEHHSLRAVTRRVVALVRAVTRGGRSR